MLALTFEECVHTITHITHLVTHCSPWPFVTQLWEESDTSHSIFRPSLERHYGWCMFPRVHVSSSKSRPLIFEHFLSMQTVPTSSALSINLIISAVTNWQSCRMTFHHFTLQCIHEWVMRQWAPVVPLSFILLCVFLVILYLFVVIFGLYMHLYVVLGFCISFLCGCLCSFLVSLL